MTSPKKAPAPKKDEATKEGNVELSSSAVESLASSLDKLAEASKKDSPVRFDSAPHVNHRFTILKDPKTGKMFLKNTATGAISAVQSESLEERKQPTGEGLEEV